MHQQNQEVTIIARDRMKNRILRNHRSSIALGIVLGVLLILAPVVVQAQQSGNEASAPASYRPA
jgi:hypothetical protein